jgi:putative flippase GtrA
VERVVQPVPPASQKMTTIRFILVGGAGALIEIGLFSLFLRNGIGMVASNILAFHIAFAICYFLHLHFTYRQPFARKRDIAAGFVKYAFLMYCQLAVGTLLLWLMIRQLDWIPELSKVIQIGIVTPVSFIVQKLVIFRARKNK